jgi:hypothetical protein
MPVGVAAYPNGAPGRRDRQPSDAREQDLATDRVSGRVDVTKAWMRPETANSRVPVVNVAKTRGARGVPSCVLERPRKVLRRFERHSREKEQVPCRHAGSSVGRATSAA